MSMSALRKQFDFFIISLLLGVFASPSNAAFKDPLDIHAIEQKTPLDKPFIGSSLQGNTIVLVGPGGLILVSVNSGSTWKQAQVPVQSDLIAVDMVSPSKGWAVGHDGVILVTLDGGTTWTKQLDGLMAAEQFKKYYKDLSDKGDIQSAAALELIELNYRDGPGLPYLDVWFRDELVGFVVGAFGNIARTDDGGATWIPWLHRINNEAGLHLNSVVGVGNDVFIGSERGTLFKLNDGKSIFEAIETGYSGSFTGMTGDEHQVIAYGLRGTVFRSVDRGINWKSITTFPRSTVNDAVRRGDGGFVFSNQAGELIFSNMQFNSFDVLSSEEAAGYTSIVEVDKRELIATTLEGVKKITVSAQKTTKYKGQE